MAISTTAWRGAENRTNVMFVPYVSRMDYAAGMFYEAIVVNALSAWRIPVPSAPATSAC